MLLHKYLVKGAEVCVEMKGGSSVEGEMLEITPVYYLVIDEDDDNVVFIPTNNVLYVSINPPPEKPKKSKSALRSPKGGTL